MMRDPMRDSRDDPSHHLKHTERKTYSRGVGTNVFCVANRLLRITQIIANYNNMSLSLRDAIVTWPALLHVLAMCALSGRVIAASVDNGSEEPPLDGSYKAVLIGVLVAAGLSILCLPLFAAAMRSLYRKDDNDRQSADFGAGWLWLFCIGILYAMIALFFVIPLGWVSGDTMANSVLSPVLGILLLFSFGFQASSVLTKKPLTIHVD